MGSNSPSTTTQVYQPTATTAPSSAEAMQAWADTLPQVMETQMQFAPQEAQQQLELLQQYGLPMAEAYKDAQTALNPETTALQEKLAGQASAGMDAEVPDWMREQYRSDLSANLGTNAGSGIGADYVSRGMMQQQQGYQDYYRNLGLSVAGRQPLSQPSAPQTSNYMAGATPGQQMNFMNQGYAAQSAANRPFVDFQKTSGGYNAGILGRWGGVNYA